MADHRPPRRAAAPFRTSTVALLLVTALLAVGAAACGGGDSSSSKSAATTTAKAGKGKTPTPTTAKKSDAKPLDGGVCNSEQLVASQQASGLQSDVTGAKGVFALENNSSKQCTLSGYPTLALFAADGSAVPTSTQQGGAEIPAALAVATITLAPGESASFLANWVTISSANCPAGTKLSITPPGNTKAVDLATSSMTLCSPGTINVSPMQSGVITG